MVSGLWICRHCKPFLCPKMTAPWRVEDRWTQSGLIPRRFKCWRYPSDLIANSHLRTLTGTLSHPQPACQCNCVLSRQRLYHRVLCRRDLTHSSLYKISIARSRNPGDAPYPAGRCSGQCWLRTIIIEELSRLLKNHAIVRMILVLEGTT